MKRIASVICLLACLPALCLTGCAIYKVTPPKTAPAGLSNPNKGDKVDFAIETLDHIDRTRSLGRVSDTFWGGQYQVKLDHSLKDYFESEVARDLRNAGFAVYRYPGEFTWKRLDCPEKPLHIMLEMQNLSFSRHPKSNYFADHVICTCKIRAVVFDLDENVVYQRQFVGNVDTYRPTDELVLPGIGLISRAGLSAVLEGVLQDTVNDFRNQGIPEIKVVFEEYRKANGKADTPSDARSETTGVSQPREEKKGKDEAEFSF